MKNFSRTSSNKEIIAKLDKAGITIDETPTVIAIEPTSNDDFVAVYVMATVKMGGTSSTKLNSFQARAKKFSGAELMLRSMEVVHKDFIEDEDIEVGDKIEGTVLQVVDSIEPFYDGQGERMYRDENNTLQPLFDKEGNYIYRKAVIIDMDEFEDHETIKSYTAEELQEGKKSKKEAKASKKDKKSKKKAKKELILE